MRRLALQIIRRLLYLGAAGVALWLMFGRFPPAPISDDLSKLEPEMCTPSVFTTTLTSIVPINVGSPTKSLATEQIALVREYKPEQRRKLWALRMPAAYIMQRPCDTGRKNWIGEGDYVQVGQLYGLGFILADDREVAATRATDQERKDGIAVFVQLNNEVSNATAMHQSNANKSYVLGGHDRPTCAEQPSTLPGLVTFKRVSPDLKSAMDCEGQFYSGGVFAHKVADRSYDVVIGCVARCEMMSDYEGWPIHYAFDRPQLEKWQIMHGRVMQFLADHTFHFDHDS
jgi:hypothetical protein